MGFSGSTEHVLSVLRDAFSSGVQGSLTTDVWYLTAKILTLAPADAYYLPGPFICALAQSFDLTTPVLLIAHHGVPTYHYSQAVPTGPEDSVTDNSGSSDAPCRLEVLGQMSPGAVFVSPPGW